MNKLTTSLAAAVLAATFSLAAVAPASADQAAATRNEIIGGLALVAGIATAINVSNKNAEANAYPYQYGGYQNDGYQNGYRDGGYQNNGYRNNGDQNGGRGWNNGDRNDQRDRR